MATQFVFLVFPEVHLMDLAGPDQCIHEAIEYDADFVIKYCAGDNNIKSSAGLPIDNLTHYSKIKLHKGDFLIIPGSNLSYFLSKEFKANKKLHEWIIAQFNNGIKLVSICAGAFALAQTGILNGVECTTHWKRTAQLQKLFPKIIVKENILFTMQNNIYTSAGIASGIDLTLYIIEQLKGDFFAHKVAREMVVYNRRDGNQLQQSELLNFRNHIHTGIHTVQDYLQENLHQNTSIGSLAEMANMSERNFARIFKKEAHITVHDYVTMLRKEKIKNWINNPNISKQQLAEKCGLKSERQLRRLMDDVN